MKTLFQLVVATALTGCADVATQIAVNAAPYLVGPAVELAGAGLQAAGEAAADGIEYTAEAVKDGYQYTAEQIETQHKFLGDEGFYELFGGPGANGGLR
ncbi:MAG: hypothetical protein HOF85_08165 [Acidiferrobacteraceae bacterium]|nr:hypothetical protein [Acidiferrobacteraceae bacterium]